MVRVILMLCGQFASQSTQSKRISIISKVARAEPKMLCNPTRTFRGMESVVNFPAMANLTSMKSLID